jgi:hypothetical protein
MEPTTTIRIRQGPVPQPQTATATAPHKIPRPPAGHAIQPVPSSARSAPPTHLQVPGLRALRARSGLSQVFAEPTVVFPTTTLRNASRTAQAEREQPAVRFNDRLKRPNGQTRPDPSRPKTDQGDWRVESGRFNRPVLHFLERCVSAARHNSTDNRTYQFKPNPIAIL